MKPISVNEKIDEEMPPLGGISYAFQLAGKGNFAVVDRYFGAWYTVYTFKSGRKNT